MRQRDEIIVAGDCLDGNCDCCEKDGLSPKIIGYPPYHGDCHCYIAKCDVCKTNLTHLNPLEQQAFRRQKIVKKPQNRRGRVIREIAEIVEGKR